MPEDKRHQRELQATLKQIRKFHGDKNAKVPRWRLETSLGRLAIEGIGVFLVGILVGLGLYVLYEIITN